MTGIPDLDIGSCFILELHPNSVIISNNNIDFITIYLLETTYFSIIGTYSIILKLQSSKPDCYPQSHFPKLGLAPFSWIHLLQ